MCWPEELSPALAWLGLCQPQQLIVALLSSEAKVTPSCTMKWLEKPCSCLPAWSVALFWQGRVILHHSVFLSETLAHTARMIQSSDLLGKDYTPFPPLQQRGALHLQLLCRRCVSPNGARWFLQGDVISCISWRNSAWMEIIKMQIIQHLYRQTP